MSDCLVYSLKEISVLLGISYSTVYKLVCSGSIPCFKIGGQYFVSRSAFDNWLISIQKGGFIA